MLQATPWIFPSQGPDFKVTAHTSLLLPYRGFQNTSRPRVESSFIPLDGQIREPWLFLVSPPGYLFVHFRSPAESRTVTWIPEISTSLLLSSHLTNPAKNFVHLNKYKTNTHSPLLHSKLTVKKDPSQDLFTSIFVWRAIAMRDGGV